MDRRQYLTAIGVLASAGCLARANSDQSQDPSDPTDQIDPTPEVDWGPVRGRAESISVEKSLTSEPGNGYDPATNMVRVVITRSGMGAPEEVKHMPFEEWVALQSPHFGRGPAARVTGERLPTSTSVDSSYSAPPDDATTDEAVIRLDVDSEVSAENGSSAAPRSVNVTASYNGTQASHSVPIYIEIDSRNPVPG